MKGTLALGVAALAATLAYAQHQSSPNGATLRYPDALVWKEGPPSLPPGAQVTVLEGDPTKPGAFVFRLRLPDGYRVPVHTHPRPERVTVISGTFHIGMGDKFKASMAQPMTAGTYGIWPAGMKHFVWVEGETVVQFHGDGPWVITYADPAEDPRNHSRK